MNPSEILPWLFSGWRLIPLLVLALVIGGLIWWAYSGDSNSEHERKDAVNIGIDIGKNAIQSNLIANGEESLKNAEIKANRANANLANSLQRDSNEFSGNDADIDDDFCSHYPRDSTCAEWRVRHPGGMR